MYSSNFSKNAIFVGVVAGLLSGLIGCGGGGGGDDGSPASPPATSTPSVSSDITTLASCISASPGKQFAVSYTTDDGYKKSYIDSFYSGTFSGVAVTVEKSHHDSDSAGNYVENYVVFTPSKVEYLGYKKYYSDSTSYTNTFSGYSLDLTVTAGQSQTINVSEVYSSGESSSYAATYVFDGVEALSIAGVTLNTCRLTASGPGGTVGRPGTVKVTMWYAAGYGFTDPVKRLTITNYSDEKTPSSETDTGELTIPLH